MTDSFPRQQGRTRRFRLGVPNGFAVSPTGSRVVFTRSNGGADPINRLVVLDVEGDRVTERIVADPLVLLVEDEELPTAERARRERMRESSAGVTTYATDWAVTVASFALSGQVGIADLAGLRPAVLLALTGPAVDPRIDPTGQRVAWVADRSLHIARIDGSGAKVLAESEGDQMTWGLANFLAAEEFDRSRGYWWAPDGNSLIVERFDESAVTQWWIAEPANPAAPAVPIRYPAAGTTNPDVSLWLFSVAGERIEILWDRIEFEYVVSVHWSQYGPALITVLNREQNRSLVLAVDHASGRTRPVAELADPAWVTHLPGTPAWSPTGQLVATATDANGILDGLSLDGDQSLFGGAGRVRAVLDIAADGLLLAVHREPTQCHVAHLDWSGKLTTLTGTVGAVGGWHTAVRGGGKLVLISAHLDSLDATRELVHWSPGARDPRPIASITSFAETPSVKLRHELRWTGPRQLATVVIWPIDHVMGSGRLPVIMNPYGGPGAQRVIESGRAFAETQWLADQGFAIIVADGRGAPGRGPAWEREVLGDLATAPLQDQVDALADTAIRFPLDIDTDRVGIVGWSFGGYLAALAVLRRPDIFHAALAGAPVTDWRLYDTAYTERYLGNPVNHPQPYDSISLLPLAPLLRRPLMIIHGLADDNVVVAHSLRLSAALTAAQRPHRFVPLSNVTHMAAGEDIAQSLLWLQVEFFKSNLQHD